MTAVDRTFRDEASQGVSIHHCSENRTVFVEQENKDGWISTDLTVALER